MRDAGERVLALEIGQAIDVGTRPTVREAYAAVGGGGVDRGGDAQTPSLGADLEHGAVRYAEPRREHRSDRGRRRRVAQREPRQGAPLAIDVSRAPLAR